MTSSRKWSDVFLPKSQRLKEKVEEKKIDPVILCQDCKKNKALVCKICKQRPILTKGFNTMGLCGGCHTDHIWNTLGSESMCIGYIRQADPRNDPPFRCGTCYKN